VRLPFEDAAVSGAALDEAAMVTGVANAFATAVTRHVLQDFGVPGGELVHGLDDRHRPGEVLLERHDRQGADGAFHRHHGDDRLWGALGGLLRLDDSRDEQASREENDGGKNGIPGHISNGKLSRKTLQPMRLGSRNDIFLLGGLAVTLFVGLSRQIGVFVEYVYEVDRGSDLQLLPALVILGTVFVVYLVRKRQQLGEETRLATARAEEMERLVALSQSVARSLDIDSRRTAVLEHVPLLVPGRGVWAASPVLSLDEPEDDDPATVRFPMVVAGTTIGVLGVPPGRTLTEQERGVLVAAAALLAASIKNAELFREVHENSVRDSLTGCFRRNHALEVMDSELRRARRSQLPLSVIMFDLDHFKAINDRHGHLCGDAVLAAVGQRMKTILRGSDVRCRYGGEEFLILLPDTPIGGARRVAENLRQAFDEKPVAWKDESIPLTASFGVTAITPGEDNHAAIIDRADAAMYRAKEEGRNRVRVHEEQVAGLLRS
jgi:diguanylate cyclase (GGDEF)-like protein